MSEIGKLNCLEIYYATYCGPAIICSKGNRNSINLLVTIIRNTLIILK